jgi:hypothetical protein
MQCVYRGRSGKRCTRESVVPVDIRFQGKVVPIRVCDVHQLKYENDPINFGRDLLVGMKCAQQSS